MTAIIVLNIVLCTFVVIGMLSLLAWGIAADRRDRTTPPGVGRHRAAAAEQRSRAQLGRALRLGA